MTARSRGAHPLPPAAGGITLGGLVRDRRFVLYLTGQTTSSLGSALSSVALVFAVMAISRSTGSVALVLLASRLPGVVLALAGGIVADRWSRKWIAVWADACRTVFQLVTGVLLLAGHATVLELAALQCGVGGASALYGPAASAMLADIAPRGQIRRAGSLLGITVATAQTGGLALSGVVVALAGPGVSLIIDGATFAVSSLASALLSVGAPVVRDRGASALSELRDGWKLVRGHGWLTTYAVHEVIVNVMVLSPLFVLGPVIAKDDLGGAPAWSAIALAYVLGNLVAAHVTYRWGPRRPVFTALVITAALAPLLALLGLAAPTWLIVPAALLAGAETTVCNTLVSASLQANLPGDALGRASAITSVGSTVLVPIGMGVTGVVAGVVGISTVMLFSAAMVLIVTAICGSRPAVRIPLRLDRPADVG